MTTVDIDLIGVPAFVLKVEQQSEAIRFENVNAAHERVTGFKPEDVIGKVAFDFLPVEIAEHFERQHRMCIETRSVLEYDEELDLPRGRNWWRTVLTPQIDPMTGVVVRVLGISMSITERKRLETMLANAVYVDHLTGVANRRRLELDVEDAIDAIVYTNRPFSLVLVDLDGFKAINDLYGHRVGDDVLRHVGGLLAMSIRKTETVARLGGDEFAIRLGATTEVELASIVTSMRRFFDRDHQIGGILLKVGMSIGSALWQRGQSFEDLLAVADEDMYREKSRRRAA